MLDSRPCVPTVDARSGLCGEKSAWLVSLFIHLLFLLVISFLSTQVDFSQPDLVLTSFVPEPIEFDKWQPESFHFDPNPRKTVGASAVGGPRDELSGVSELLPLPQLPSLEIPPQAAVGQVEARELFEATTSVASNLNYSVKGAAGVAVEGADGAIDRLTQEILASLDERNTLVVWFFDQSGSLQTQRKEILRRFNRVYDELGAIEAGATPSARPTIEEDPPLLTSVISFGDKVQFLTPQPTHDLDEIKSAVSSVQRDETGIERVFTAVQRATQRFRKFRSEGRNILFILFTDEAGDDTDALDSTVQLCRRLEIPVYVVGVPAPFGRRETLVKWVDPDPKYDQSVQWGRVDQGPESYLPERVKLMFNGFREDESPIDSGFGPFALTRLCFETGGIYFTVHPNRQTGRRVGRRETETYNAYFSAFFDPDTMRRYRPDYVSAKEYLRQVDASRLRTSLLHAAQQSWIEPLERPRRRFVVRREADFVAELTEAQKAAAKLSPMADKLYDILQQGQVDREREISPRWQAGYDLAIGRVLATKVRADGYNAMLAQAKRGMKFSKPKHNTWILQVADEISVSSRLQQQADLAREYLERVTRDHPGTPWALLASRELDVALGWQWTEAFTSITPRPRTVRAANNNNPSSTPKNDQARKLRPAPKKRPPPKL